MNHRSFVSSVKEHYDKLLSACLLTLLLACLCYLGLRMGTMRWMQRVFNEQIEQMVPAHPQAQKLDVTAYTLAKERIEKPVQVGGWTNMFLFVPETRVWCVDCQRPIPLRAVECPFCKARQPVMEGDDPNRDTDRDGMRDVWELKYKLNPNDPTDAALDSDGDGFLNVEEFRYETNPRDAADHPPVTAWLRVKSIVPKFFNLLFTSVQTLPDGSQKFGINARDRSRTYFAKMGEEVEGFVLTKFETNFVPVTRGHMNIMEDKSILTLKWGEKVIQLVKGEKLPYTEFSAVLVSRVDNTELSVMPDSTFEVKGEQFKVISIDSVDSTVVIERPKDGKRLKLGKLAESETKESSEDGRKETP